MPIARRALLASMMAAATGPALPRLACADPAPVRLKLHHFFSSVSCAHEKFLTPWARKVEAESNGRIRIDIFPSMQLGGAPAQLFDQARAGLADIVWAAPSSTPGRFAGIEAFELPFLLSHRALVNSRALEDYAAANLREEFGDFHPISFSCRDGGVVHANRPIRSIADLRGLRLHVPNRLAAAAVRALGARDVAAPIPQVPMAVARHVIDGCLDPWDLMPALRLDDLLKCHADFAESSLSTTTLVLVMNKSAYARLPSELKAVIDNNSGQCAAGMAGAMWDLEAAAVADRARERGDPVTTLPAAAVELARAATAPVMAAWLRQMKERKVDGGRLIASARAFLARYAHEPEPRPPSHPAQPQAKAAAMGMTKANSAAPVSKPKELDIPL
jgi:TRAP-type C4-dicarboxylate transport system substrate-binding protein